MKKLLLAVLLSMTATAQAEELEWAGTPENAMLCVALGTEAGADDKELNLYALSADKYLDKEQKIYQMGYARGMIQATVNYEKNDLTAELAASILRDLHCKPYVRIAFN